MPEAPKTPAPKTTATPKPTEIIELVEFTSATKLALLFALGLAAGLACYWLATHVMVEDATDG